MSSGMGMRTSVGWAVLAGMLAALPAAAVINPGFTPRHLAEQSDTIVAGTVARGAAAGTWNLAKPVAVKGQADAGYVFTLENGDPDQTAQLRECLAGSEGQPLVLFTGTMNGALKTYLHTGGRWLEGEPVAGKKSWQVKGSAAAKLDGTYAGGTDQLVRMMEYLTKDPDARVPISAGVRWLGGMTLVGKAAGPVSGLAGVRLGQAGKRHVFSASTNGDSLFLAETAKFETVFTNVTAAAGLRTSSAVFTWCDLNADGLADLVSSDGQALVVCFGRPDGAFAAAGKEWSMALESGCIGLTPCGMGSEPGILVTSHAGPLWLLAQKAGGWKKVALPDDGGNAAAGALVADFNGDGYADLLLPGDAGGLLWKGGAEGFAKPVSCSIGTGGEPAKLAMDDFNQDGAMDVFVAGASRSWLWENDGKGSFNDVLGLSGAPGYKCAPAATDVRAMDLNQDGCPDLCLVYGGGEIVYFFNRGFRAFAEEGEVRLPGLGVAGEAPPGLVAVATDDFNADDSMDLVVATAGNAIACFLNEMSSRPGLLLRLPVGSAAPVTVSAWQGEDYPVSSGVVVVPDALGTYVSARDMGNVVLKWTAPGKGPCSKAVVVEDKTKAVTVP